ncbi:imidazoleglycerol-phosphate dehydratase HisB [Verrucomicrobiota bacterium]
MKKRTAKTKRKTRETDIAVELTIDGTGKSSISTGLPFLDHMLELLAKHSLMDLKVRAKGDVAVDYHHITEDLGLVLGAALDQALGTRRGITRYGDATVPMDEALGTAVVDLGGRPYLVYNIGCRKKKILDFDLGLVEEFFRALVTNARMNLHIDQPYGKDAHHAYEAVFKAVARALRAACTPDPRRRGVPSSKGRI